MGLEVHTAMPASKRFPDFFIVGHPKSGTTALHRMLRRHPQIFMPKLKEPWFFATDFRERRAGKLALPHTVEEYLALFEAAPPDQRIGEGSPSYLLSRTAAGAIAEVQPNARCIAILREPASFLHSLHLQLLQTHIEQETSLRKAIALESARREGREIPWLSDRPQLLLYSEHVRYVEQLRRYESVFPAEQLLVLIYDDFRADNEAAIRKILRFLDVDDAAPIAVKEANPTVVIRSQRLYRLARKVGRGQGPLARALAPMTRRLSQQQRGRLGAFRDRLIVRSARSSDADERLMGELRRRFEPEVVALSEHLGRDLVTLWGYDRLD